MCVSYGRGKVVPVLNENVWGNEGIAPPFSTLALEGEWSVSRHGRFTLNGRASSTHWIGGWVGLRVGLDAVEKTAISAVNGTRAVRTVLTVLFLHLVFRMFSQ
jgi:hypothetical protein